MLHGLRERVRHMQRTVQRAADTVAAAGIATGVGMGAVAARDFYEKARPALLHSRPRLVRGVDAALSSFDAIRPAIR